MKGMYSQEYACNEEFEALAATLFAGHRGFGHDLVGQTWIRDL
ncbi:MAG: hypothetical protein ACREQZ_13850 [Woeseiaceae bacterium]